ncbi:MAG TPA: VOC family protein [Verrucomicrobiae bacterium]|nr:VOC family protein [Verrucomicrobiae bacterium]
MGSPKIQSGQKITPFLWFDRQAEEAARFYTSIFKKSRIVTVMRATGGAAKKTGHKAGSVLTVEFELAGQRFVALNGGPLFKFNEAVSFVVNCKTQADVDRYWDALSAGGEERECGWLRDKFGVFWQITPSILLKLINDPDTAKAERAFEAMLRMTRIDIKALKDAVR